MEFSNDNEVVDCYGVVTAGCLGESPGNLKEGLIEDVKGAKNFSDAYISQHRNFNRELDGLTAY